MLIAQMITRNEAGRFLPSVLDHLNRFVDLVVVTDDGSEDDTAQMCEDFGAKVMQVGTDKSPLFTYNEGELRQLAWAHLTSYAIQGDWILCIDADEKLYGLETLPGLLDQNNWDVLGIWFYHFWNVYQYRVDKAWRPSVSSRLFRFYPDGEFKKSKLACGSEPLYVQELIRQRKVKWDTELRMAHLGYIRPQDKVEKYKRYMEHDKGDFHSRAHIESIADLNPTLVNWEGPPIL